MASHDEVSSSNPDEYITKAEVVSERTPGQKVKISILSAIDVLVLFFFAPMISAVIGILLVAGITVWAMNGRETRAKKGAIGVLSAIGIITLLIPIGFAVVAIAAAFLVVAIALWVLINWM